MDTAKAGEASPFVPESSRSLDKAEVGEGSPLVPDEEEEAVPLWHWALAPVCGLLVMFSVPSMTYGLYKPSLVHVLDLTATQSQLIVSFGLVGGMILGFVPGIIYDKFGYVVTLCLGGAMATTGASLVALFLKAHHSCTTGSHWCQISGSPGSPNWFLLALSFMVMCHGCRTQYFAGMCAVLSIFPARLAGSMSAFMAIMVSLGYIILPSVWKHGFMPAENDTENYDVDKKELKNLNPVAGFFFFLAVSYSLITICGLGIASKLPARKKVSGGGDSRLAQRLETLQKPATMALLTFAALSIAFVYTFMTSGIADASVKAGASAADRGSVLLNVGIIGMVGRFVHGSGADMLSSHTPAKQAGPHIAAISAVSSTLVGFFLLMSGLSWSSATYFIGFGFGGIFALFPASARRIFGAADVGFGLGVVFFMVGVMNFLYGLLGVALGYGEWFYVIGSVGSVVTLLIYAGLAVTEWGQ